jgi:hypothetical protein
LPSAPKLPLNKVDSRNRIRCTIKPTLRREVVARGSKQSAGNYYVDDLDILHYAGPVPVAVLMDSAFLGLQDV